MLRSPGYVGRFNRPRGSNKNIILDGTTSKIGNFSLIRNSTGLVLNSPGIYYSNAINTPRFDKSPISLAPTGLLLEEGRVNKLAKSADLNDTAYWSYVTVSVTANGAGKIDGKLRWLVAQLSSTANRLEQVVTTTAGTKQVFWCIAYPGTSVGPNLRIDNNGQVWQYNFDLTAGTYAKFGTATADKVYMVPLGDGVYICGYVYTATGTSTIARLYPGSTYPSNVNIDIAQHEEGAFLTSGIVTGAGQGTRDNDTLTIPLANIPLFNNAEGTFVFDFDYIGGINAQRAITLYNSADANNNVIYIEPLASSNLVSISAGVLSTAAAGSAVAGTSIHMALSYKDGDISCSINKGTVATLASSLPVNMDTLKFFSTPSGTGRITGLLKAVEYIPYKIPNSALNGL
mgnify:CR=1 FL=1